MVHYKFTFFLFGLILFFSFGTLMAQQDNILDSSFAPNFESFTGAVNVITKQPDGKILVGGYFLSANGGDRFGLARFNTDGTLDLTFNPFLGVFPTGVRAIAVQPDGKILVGGLFTASNQTQTNLVRLNANGTLDSTFTGRTSSTVYAIAIQPDGKILIGGTFSSVNSITRFGAARLNTNGTLDTSFTFSIAAVATIVIQPDGNILLGGNFSLTSPNVITRIVRVSSTGAVDTAFSANASANATVRSLKLQTDGKIVLGGSFSIINGSFRNNLARLNLDGTLDISFNPSITGFSTTSVENVDIDSSGKIIFGGMFSGVNGNPRGNIAKVNPDGTLDTTFSPSTGANLTVRAVVAETDGNYLIGGDFLLYDGALKFRFARLNENGSLNTSFNAALNSSGSISEVEILPDGKILAAGSFFYVNGIGYGSIARFNANGTLDSTFATYAQSLFYGDLIEDIEIQPDGKILVVGNLFISTSSTTYGIARLNANGTIDNSFSPVTIMSDLPTVVKALPNGQILVGGRFNELNGTPRNGFARLNSNGSLDTTFNPSISGSSFPVIMEIGVKADGKIIIGGSFNTIDSTMRNNLARLNPNGTLDDSFSANASGSISSINLLSDEKLLVGGNFSTIGGFPRNRIAKLLPDGQIDASFNPASNLTMPSLVIKTYTDDRIIAAGSGNPGNLVVLNADGSTNTVFPNNQWFSGGIFNSNLINDVEVQQDGKVIIGGTFTKVGTSVRVGLARLNSINLPKKSYFDFEGDGKTDISIFRPDVGEWWIQRSSTNQTIAAQFGNSTDRIVPADFTGDGKTDVAIWRPSSGEWFVLRSEDSSFYSFPFGTSGDTPIVGDFDADGKADAGVFRPSNLTWFISKSSGGTIIQQFGTADDKPVPADYDGDGKTDIAIFRANGANGAEWWIQRSSNNSVFAATFGNATDKAAQGDFTGDGKTDIAVWRPSNGNWFILRSEDFSFFAFPFGANGDVPVAGDYDGDGKFDAGVFRPTNQTWYVQRSTAGTLIQQFGIAGDLPTPNAFVP